MAQIPCPLCGVPGFVQEDKRGFPWWGCPSCRTRIFFHTDVGVIGFLLCAGMVKKTGQQRWNEEIAEMKKLAIEREAYSPTSIARVFTDVLTKEQKKEMEVRNERVDGQPVRTSEAGPGSRREADGGDVR